MDGYIAGMVAWDIVLFEGGFMFFVEDDQSQMRHWSEDCRAWSYDDLDIAVADSSPLKMSLGTTHVRVEDGHRAESVLEAAAGLGSEADFGDQDDRLAAKADRFFDRLHVDLGLTATGHAVEQDGRVLLGV